MLTPHWLPGLVFLESPQAAAAAMQAINYKMINGRRIRVEKKKGSMVDEVFLGKGGRRDSPNRRDLGSRKFQPY